MSRYEPLAQFLDRRSVPVWQAKFSEIEKVLGFPLPPSAYRYPAWWANQQGKGHSQTAGWKTVGWHTRALNLEERRVTFERESPTASASSPALTFEQRGAIEFLIALGGTAPDFVAPPRRRVDL
jgi:hypothetical protein